MGQPDRPTVLQIITHLDLGGAEEVAISLAEGLYQDFDFHFFAVQGMANTEIGRNFRGRLDACGIPVYSGTRLDMKRGGIFQAGWQLRALIERLRPQIIHVHTEIPEATYAWARALGVRAPHRLIRTIHNSTLWPAWQRIGAWTERALRDGQVVVVSQGAQEGLWRFQGASGRPQTPPARMRLIHNGVAREATVPVSRTMRDVSQPARILFAGRFEEQKGVDLLPAILQQASRLSRREARVTIAGQGRLQSLLDTWIRQTRLPWSIEISPPIPDLSGVLNSGKYDLLLMPSRFEGLGLLAIEAIIAGIPVVTFEVAGLREIFPSTYPLLAKAEDVAGLATLLARSVDEPEFANQQAADSRLDIMRRFSWRGMADGYADVYRSASGFPAVHIP